MYVIYEYMYIVYVDKQYTLDSVLAIFMFIHIFFNTPGLGNGKLGLSVVFKPITSEIKSVDAKNFSLCAGFTFCFPENNARNIC